jgi:hypothetical protein
MNDPHVVWLRYRLETTESLGFQDPDPIEGTTDTFDWRLDGGELTLNMKQYFASVEEARETVGGFLRSWELDVGLQQGRESVFFKYIDAEMIDRNPPPPDSQQVIQASVGSVPIGTGTASIHVTRNDYPPPPAQFAASPDVESLWHRYQGYVEGREPLLAMAHFCLTMLESGFRGNRRLAAAAKYRIHRSVLRKLGELTSQRGDEKTARKGGRPFAPLTPSEENWTQSTIKVIIRRVGEHDARGTAAELPVITMKDLPSL